MGSEMCIRDRYIKPSFLPIKLITFVAKIAPTAIPTTDIDIGNVESDFKGLIWDPIIPLKNTVIGAAVKLKIWLKVSVSKFLFIKKYIYQKGKVKKQKPYLKEYSTFKLQHLLLYKSHL